jgi:predicted nucleic acid-binding protein
VGVLFDTSILVGGENLDLTGVDDDDEVLVSAVSIAELAYGLGLGDATERGVRVARFDDALQAYEIVPFGVEEAKLYGVLADLVRASGRDPRPRRMDLQIAATAAAAHVPLITANPADFAGLERMVRVIPVRSS